MRNLLFLLLILVISTNSIAQEIYSEIRLNNTTQLELLNSEGFAVDHIQFDEEGLPILIVSEREVLQLNVLGVPYETTIANYAENYRNELEADIIETGEKSALSTDGFDLGTMGGFYTFDQVVAKLDEMKTDFPNLITAKQSIGTTAEGRAIWMVKISDNPDIDEDEPVGYFDALHHAREPLSMAVTINYMFYLLENYATDAAVQYLVNNRELYFVPVVNPDGYVYNETTNPEGGGLWRKNRFQTSPACLGVDLNRNYSFAYGDNESCSSTVPCSQTYRGTEAFSEPETTAVSNLLSTINPKTAYSIHSTAGTFLMPYGYNTSPPEYPIYSEWASAFLDENDYTYGTTFQILGYTSCGTTRDYMHSEGIYGWTPEIGGSGFWPLPSTILDLVAENIRPMLYQSWISGSYIDVQSHTELVPAIVGQTSEIAVEIKNVGLEDTTDDVTVAVVSNNPLITVPSEMSYSQVPARTKQNNLAAPFQIEIDPSFNEQYFDLEIQTFQGGALNETATITVFVGNGTTILFDAANSDTNTFTSYGTGSIWNFSIDDSYSGDGCYSDSVGGNGLNDTDSYFELNTPLNLTNTTGPVLTFMTKYSIALGDITTLEISVDDGENWDVLGIYNLNESWNMKSYNLAAYNGFEQVRIRFHTLNDGFRPGDGFYFDDFSIVDYDEEILSNATLETLNQIVVSPNPFTTRLELFNTNNLQLSLTLYDILGNVLKQTTETSNKTLAIENLDSLSKGIYFLKAETENGQSLTFKVIK